MYTDGYIKIKRDILEWGWYQDPNTRALYFHLLLKANYKEGHYLGHTIKRGQLVTGRKKLCEELNMTEQEIRTALEHLKSTNEITIETTSKYSIITVISYDEHQNTTNEVTSRATNNQPATNQQLTSKQPQYNKYNKRNKYNNAINDLECHRNYNIDDFDSDLSELLKEF